MRLAAPKSPAASPASPEGHPISVVMFVSREYREQFFPSPIVSEIEEIAGRPVRWIDPKEQEDHLEELAQAEALFSTWGTPLVDAAFLERVPRLRGFFYAAGSVKYCLGLEVFERGIVVCSAASANAVPVAEFALGAILLSLKQTWRSIRQLHSTRTWEQPLDLAAGAYGSKVGIVSLGLTGLTVVERLRPFALEVSAYDPFFDPDAAAKLGVKLTSLDRIFEESDVVSIHTPLLPETFGMVDGRLMRSMKPGATLINTARGSVINEPELYDVFRSRADLTAVLDVTEPEPPPRDSPLWSMPNVFITPHIAGSLGPECRRMSKCVVDEFRRYRNGDRLHHAIHPERLAVSA